jgi:alpha-mannosidase
MPSSRFLLPGPSLEDFPTEVSEPVAASLLATWTALWHPVLLSTAGVPRWQRADGASPPTVEEWIAVPESSVARLPGDFISQAISSGARLIQGSDRSAALRGAGLAATAWDEDFFALGFAYLQIQLMTRRLRYSSNLNEELFAQAVCAAAIATAHGQPKEIRGHLQQAFDLLAQERDHYFSGDPHLIDVALVASSSSPADVLDELHSNHPNNLLVGSDTIEQLARRADELVPQIKARIQAGELSLAGGLPDEMVPLACLSASDVRIRLAEGRRVYQEICDASPAAFARLTEGCAGDLAGPLGAAGYRGAIFADFLAGLSSGESEGKLRWEGGGGRMDAITAEPLDASSQASLLAIGPKLGKGLDAGGTATAVLAHWAGRRSTAFNDLCRAAKWTLALGKFRTLARYFSETASPYHSFRPPADRDSGSWLEERVSAGHGAPLTELAQVARRHVWNGHSQQLRSLLQSASGSRAQEISELLPALGGQPQTTGNSIVLLNPWSWPSRTIVDCQANGCRASAAVYATETVNGRVSAAIDVPAMGFATVVADQPVPRRKWWPCRAIADRMGLRNEFLEVAIDERSGGIQAVYSASQRGTLGAWQLARHESRWGDEPYTKMVAESIRAVATQGLTGSIEVRGTLCDAAGKTTDQFLVRYSLPRGQRGIQIDVELQPLLELLPDPWQSYVAGRTAWDDETASLKPIVRSRLRLAKNRRLFAPLGVLVQGASHTLLISGNGLPAHCRSGARMLDTLLLVCGESEVRQRLNLIFDSPRPVAAAYESVAPSETHHGWQLPADSGWFFAVDQANVMASDWRSVFDQQRVVGVRGLLVETTGQAVQVQVSSCRRITSASLLDGLDQTTQPLQVEDDSISVWLAAHQQQAIEMRFE